jgi:acetyl-CoA acetyltransferase
MKTYGLSHETLAMVSVVQREWAAQNRRATFKTPITVEDVLNSRMIAYPFRLLQCCLVTDGGGALILVAAERARDFPQKPVYLLGTGESVETPMVSQMEDFTSSRAFRVAGPHGHCRGRHHAQGTSFAHLPICGLEDLGFVSRGKAGTFSPERNTAPGGNSRSTPMPVATPTCIPACTRCRRACAPDVRHRPRPNPRCQDLGVPRRRRHVRPPPAPSSCRTRRPRPRFTGGIPKLAILA